MLSLTAQEATAELTDALAAGKLDAFELLTSATSLVSRLRGGTWVALVMNADPNTSLAVSGDHAHPELAAWIDAYLASLDRPHVVPTTGFPRSVIETGEPVLLPRLRPEELWHRAIPAARTWFERHPAPTPVDSVGTVVVPMHAREQLVGTLQQLAWNAAPLNEDDVRWAQLVADRLGVIVEHALCHAASIARLERLNAMRNVCQTIASTDDLRLMLEVVLDQLTGRLHVDAAAVLVVDDATAELYLGAAVGFRSAYAPDLRIPLPEHGPDSSTDTRWVGEFRRRSLFVRERFEAYRAVPVVANGRLVAVLEVFHRSAFDADQEVLSFLDVMAAHTAFAVQKAQLRTAPPPAPAASAAKPPPAKPELTRTEWRILAMVVDGATNREIAAAVHLSENTIKFHIRRLLDRLGAVNRTDLARKVTKLTWL